MEIQERVPETETIRALRLSLPLFGDGFIEAIPDQAIIAQWSWARPHARSAVSGS